MGKSRRSGRRRKAGLRQPNGQPRRTYVDERHQVVVQRIRHGLAGADLDEARDPIYGTPLGVLGRKICIRRCLDDKGKRHWRCLVEAGERYWRSWRSYTRAVYRAVGQGPAEPESLDLTARALVDDEVVQPPEDADRIVEGIYDQLERDIRTVSQFRAANSALRSSGKDALDTVEAIALHRIELRPPAYPALETGLGALACHYGLTARQKSA